MVLLAVFGCVLPNPGKECDTSAAVSVSVTVVGPTEATVTWEQDGVETACDAWPDGSWSCGYEVAGDVTIRVTAEGYVDHEEVVTVEQGECHVVGRAITVTMTEEADPVDCTDEERPSVRVTVEGSGGEGLSNVAVTWAPPDQTPTACEGLGSTWTCGGEQAGVFEVTAVADGHEAETQTVEVPMTEDECHVVTQEITFSLEWLPD